MSTAPLTYDQVKQKLRMELATLLEYGPKGSRILQLDRQTISTQLHDLLNNTHREGRQPAAALSEQDETRLVEELANEIIGTGPLEALLADPQVSEIMVNGPQQIYVERQGHLERTDLAFHDTNHLMAVIERLLDTAGLTVTEAEPFVVASLSNGARMNVVIPPLALNGPTVTIRKKLRRLSIDELLTLETLSPEVVEFLQACVKARVNMIVSGGTSTGKTTLVSVLSTFIPPEERLITIEKVAELELLNRQHWVRLVGRSPNLEGRGEVSLRILVQNALHMRPDRIILGEARGGEALDIIQAMQTGHDGCITVLHANSPQAMLERLETLMLMSGLEIPIQFCRLQIERAVDLVIHMARYADGSRRIASICHIVKDAEGGIKAEDLFTFTIQGFQEGGHLEGGLCYTGIRPKFVHKFHLHNVPAPKWLANPGP